MNKLVKAINASPKKAYIAMTGGGTRFVPDFLEQGGGSNTILGITIPYSQQEFDYFLGGPPDKYVSGQAARSLAMASYQRAKRILPEERANLIGIGSTVSLAKGETLGERFGRQHKIYIAVQTEVKTTEISAILEQGRTREEEEKIVADMILNVLFFESLNANLDAIKVLPDFLNLNIEVINSIIPISEIFGVDVGKSPAIFSGSFNPFHKAHETILNKAEKYLGKRPILEICSVTEGKPPIDFLNLNERLKSIGDEKVIITDKRLFKEKSDHLFANGADEITFVVGADTIRRILDPKYGWNTLQIKSYMEQGLVKFLCFTRGDDKLEDLVKHSAHKKYINVIEIDIQMSSTEIRKKNQ